MFIILSNLCSGILEQLSKHLASQEANFFEKESINNYLRNFAEKNDIPFNKLMQLLRGVLSGLKVKMVFRTVLC